MLTENSKYIIRTSDRQTFKQCRTKWDFGSKIRQNYEPLVLPQPLEFGTAIHKALEVYYDPEMWGTDRDVQKALAKKAFLDVCKEHKKHYLQIRGTVDMPFEIEDEFEERVQLGVGMLDYYFWWAPKHDQFKPVKAEIEFEVPVKVSDYLLTTQVVTATEHEVRNGNLFWISPDRTEYWPVVYQGRIDLIVEEPDGSYWIIDHKTAKQAANTQWLSLDEQCGSYVWALDQLGIRTAGVIYSELFKRVPHEPKVNKNGSLSVNKQQDTTYELFIDFCKRNNYDAGPQGPYAEYIQFLKDNPKSFIRRTQVHRTPQELDVLGERICLEAIDMLNNPSIYPSPGRMNCNGCWFYDPCLATQESGDVQFMLDNLFTKREKESTPAT